VNNVPKKKKIMINLRFITYGIREKVTTLGLNTNTIVPSIYSVLNKKTNQSFGYKQKTFFVLVIKYGN
jgi:hypothetical protein